MKIRTVQLLGMSLVILWLVAVVAIGEGKAQGILWNLGLLMIAFGMTMLAQYIWWLHTSNDLIWPSGKTSLRAQSESDIAVLPKTISASQSNTSQSTRSNEFLMFMGGLHRFSTRYTLPREVLFVNKDVLRVDRGDLVHNYIRSQPVWYRTHPNMKAGERRKSRLPMEFKNLLVKYGIPDDTPVGVAWEPIGLELDEKKFREYLPYREQYESVNSAFEAQGKILDRMTTTSTNIASTAEAHSRGFVREARGPKPTLVQRLTERKDEDDDERY